MASLPKEPRKLDIDRTPASVKGYIKQLIRWAVIGIKYAGKAYARVSLGDAYIKDGKKFIQVVITVLMKGKPLPLFKISEILINGGDELRGDVVNSGDKGIYSFYYEADIDLSFLEVSVMLDNDEDQNVFSDSFPVPEVKEKKASRLNVAISGIKDKIVSKLRPDGTILVKVFTNDSGKGITGNVSVDSSGKFFISATEYDNSTPSPLTTSDGGVLVLPLKPTEDEQTISISLEGTNEIFEFTYKKEVKKAEKLRAIVPAADDKMVVRELDDSGCFLVHVVTTDKNKEGVTAEFKSTSSGRFWANGIESPDGSVPVSLFTANGDLAVNFKPSQPRQVFVVTLPETAQVVTITYLKMEADELIITIPNEKNGVVCESTVNEGFLTTFETFLSKKGIRDDVLATSLLTFRYKLGDTWSSLVINHLIPINKIETIIIDPSDEWQKINFRTTRTKPQEFEYRKVR